MDQSAPVTAVPARSEQRPPVAMIAHELNNVLATISGYGTFVRDELAGGNASALDLAQMLEDAQVVLDAARRGAELTAQLMKLGPVEST